MTDSQGRLRVQEFTLRTNAQGDFDPPATLEVQALRRRQGTTYRLTHDQVVITTDPPGAIQFQQDNSIDPSGGSLFYRVTPSRDFLEAVGSHLEEGIPGTVKANLPDWPDSDALLERFVIYLESDLLITWSKDLEPHDSTRLVIEREANSAFTIEARIQVRDRADRPSPDVDLRWEVRNRDGTIHEYGRTSSDLSGLAVFRYSAPAVGFGPECKSKQEVRFYHDHEMGGKGPGESAASSEEVLATLEIYFKPRLKILLEKPGIRPLKQPLEVEYADEVVVEGRGLRLAPVLKAFPLENAPDQFDRAAQPEAARDGLQLQPPAQTAELGHSLKIRHGRIVLDDGTVLEPASDGYPLTIGENSHPADFEELSPEFQLSPEIELSLSKLRQEARRTQEFFQSAGIGNQLQVYAEKASRVMLERVAGADPASRSESAADSPDAFHKPLWAGAEFLRSARGGFEELKLALPLYEKAYDRVTTLTIGFIIEMLTPDAIDDAARKIASGQMSFKEGRKAVQGSLLKKATSATARLSEVVDAFRKRSLKAKGYLDEAAASLSRFDEALLKLTEETAGFKQLVRGSRTVAKELQESLDEVAEKINSNRNLMEKAAEARDVAYSQTQTLERNLKSLERDLELLELQKSTLQRKLGKGGVDASGEAAVLRKKLADLEEESAGLPDRIQEFQREMEGAKLRRQEALRNFSLHETEATELRALQQEIFKQSQNAQRELASWQEQEQKLETHGERIRGLREAAARKKSEMEEFQRYLWDQEQQLQAAAAALASPNPDHDFIKTCFERFKKRTEAGIPKIRAVQEKFAIEELEKSMAFFETVMNTEKVFDKGLKTRQFYKNLEFIFDRTRKLYQDPSWENFFKFVQRIDKSAVGKGTDYEYLRTETEKLRTIAARSEPSIPAQLQPNPEDEGLIMWAYSGAAAFSRRTAEVGYEFLAGLGSLFKLHWIPDLLASLFIKFVSWFFFIISIIARLFIGVANDAADFIELSDGWKAQTLRERLRRVAGIPEHFFDPSHVAAPLISFWEKFDADLYQIATICVGLKDDGSRKPKGDYGALLSELQREGGDALVNLCEAAIKGDEATNPLPPNSAKSNVDRDLDSDRRESIVDLARTFELGEGKSAFDKDNNLQIFKKLTVGKKWADGHRRYWNAFNMDFIIDYAGWMVETISRLIALLGLVAAPFTAGESLWVTAGGVLFAEIIGVVRAFVQMMFAWAGAQFQVVGLQTEILFSQMENFDYLLKQESHSNR